MESGRAQPVRLADYCKPPASTEEHQGSFFRGCWAISSEPQTTAKQGKPRNKLRQGMHSAVFRGSVSAADATSLAASPIDILRALTPRWNFSRTSRTDSPQPHQYNADIMEALGKDTL